MFIAPQLTAGAILFVLNLCAFLARHFAVRFCAALRPADAALIAARLGRLPAGKLTTGGATADAFALQSLPLIDPGCGHLGLRLI